MHLWQQAKDRIRDSRKKAIHDLEKLNLPKQWLRWNVEQIQKLHDGSVATGEKIAQSKVKELDVSEI